MLKLKEGYLKREIVGSWVVVPVGGRVVDFKGVMTLKGIAPFLWPMLQDGATEEAMLAAVTEKYEVDEATAKQDIARFVAKLAENEMLEP